MKLKENKTMELEKSLNEYLEKIEKYLKPLIVSERVDAVLPQNRSLSDWEIRKNLQEPI